jgi:acyl-CoA reductase-like NAD-dependent aldehyde dehydrogenase
MAATAIPVGALPSLNPATGEILGCFPKTLPAHLPYIVSLSRAVQTNWAKLPVTERSARLKVLRERMMASRHVLADAVVRESGKPRVEALFADVFVALDTADFFAKNAERLLRAESVPHHSLAAKAKTGTLTYEPFGVIGIITSWNYPLAIPLGQIIPAVAAGNAVICKSSDFTPQCGALIQKLFVEAGFPKDLVTIVQGGGEVGQALIGSRPDKVLFTGSVATGVRVAEACAKSLIPTVLELGGKDAMIVLGDADVNVAASAAVWGGYTNCGQVCLSVERLFVERSVSEAFAACCVEKTKKLRLGPGTDPETDVGPLIRPQYVQRMSDLLQDAVSRGAWLPMSMRQCVFFRRRPSGRFSPFRPLTTPRRPSRAQTSRLLPFRRASGRAIQAGARPSPGSCAPGPLWSTTSSATSQLPKLPTVAVVPADGAARTARRAYWNWSRPSISTSTGCRSGRSPGGIVTVQIWSAPPMLFCSLNTVASSALVCATPAAR